TAHARRRSPRTASITPETENRTRRTTCRYPPRRRRAGGGSGCAGRDCAEPNDQDRSAGGRANPQGMGPKKGWRAFDVLAVAPAKMSAMSVPVEDYGIIGNTYTA